MMARMTQCHCVAASHRYFDKICFFMLEESLSVSDSLSETRASGHASSRTWQASRQVRAALPAGRPQCRASRSRWAAPPGKPKPVGSAGQAEAGETQSVGKTAGRELQGSAGQAEAGGQSVLRQASGGELVFFDI